jgi:hypothetical protein
MVGHYHRSESSNSIVLFEPGKAIEHCPRTLGPPEKRLPRGCCRRHEEAPTLLGPPSGPQGTRPGRIGHPAILVGTESRQDAVPTGKWGSQGRSRQDAAPTEQGGGGSGGSVGAPSRRDRQGPGYLWSRQDAAPTVDAAPTEEGGVALVVLWERLPGATGNGLAASGRGKMPLPLLMPFPLKNRDAAATPARWVDRVAST